MKLFGIGSDTLEQIKLYLNYVGDYIEDLEEAAQDADGNIFLKFTDDSRRVIKLYPIEYSEILVNQYVDLLFSVFQKYLNGLSYYINEEDLTSELFDDWYNNEDIMGDHVFIETDDWAFIVQQKV